MATVAKINRGLEKILQADLLAPSICELALLDEKQQKARIKKYIDDLVKLD